jgi:hypothetical protein
MALLAEELVEEWLNRLGYFTIRGLKVGVHEIDILAVRPIGSRLECRQIEAQASVRPISYISPVPKDVQKATGRAPTTRRCEQQPSWHEVSTSGSRRSTVIPRRTSYVSAFARAIGLASSLCTS